MQDLRLLALRLNTSHHLLQFSYQEVFAGALTEQNSHCTQQANTENPISLMTEEQVKEGIGWEKWVGKSRAGQIGTEGVLLCSK